MRRCDFITLLGGATAALPLAARAQQMPVIGLLHSASPEAFAPFLAALREGLSEAGFIDGQNVRIDLRWAEGQYEIASDGERISRSAGGVDHCGRRRPASVGRQGGNDHDTSRIGADTSQQTLLTTPQHS